MLRFPKSRPRALTKSELSVIKKRQYAKAAKFAKKRDAGRCRICRKPGYEAHHIVFRSLGGKDEPRNLVTLCSDCHRDVHGHVVKLSGTAKKLVVRRWSDDAHDWVAA